MIDLRKSRRNKFIDCIYWCHIKDNNRSKFSELTYETQPSGFFSCSVVGNYTEENQTLEDSFMFKKVTTVVETVDDVRDLERNDKVEMDNEIYRVKSIERVPTQKQRQFLSDEYISYTTYISLVR